MSNARHITCNVIVLLGVGWGLVIVVRKLISHCDFVTRGNPRHHIYVMMIRAIPERKVSVRRHVNIVPDVGPSLSIFEGIYLDVEFTEERMLIK